MWIDPTEERSRNEQITVGTTSTEIAPARCRSVIFIRNTSTGGQVITVCMGFEQAVANAGIVLEPGEVFCDSNSEGYICWQGVITAISDTSGGKLSIYER